MIDQSRVAVAVTAERLKNDAVTRELGSDPLPDFSVEHWGIYEADKLSRMPQADFQQFILHCFDARIRSDDRGIHGYKGGRAQVPVWVGPANPRQRVTAQMVNEFAEAITRLDRYRSDEALRDGAMLAWGFAPEASRVAEQLKQRDQLEIGFVRLDQVRFDSQQFRSHIASQSTERGDYSNFLTFVQPPSVEIDYQQVGGHGRTYNFDASGTDVMNAGAEIINVQWDFSYDGQAFQAAPSEWLGRDKKKGILLAAQHEFPRRGRFVVACKVQDDHGGEGMQTIDVEVR